MTPRRGIGFDRLKTNVCPRPGITVQISRHLQSVPTTNMLTVLTTLLAFLVPFSISSSLDATIGGGIGPYPKYGKIIQEGNSHPSGTRTVRFALGPQEDWSLRINVSKLAVPGSSSSTDMKFVNTVYDLQWPGPDTINKTVAAVFGSEQDPKLCGSIVFSDFPANVTNAWEEGDSSCESALGHACLDALIKKYSTAASESHNANSGNGCPSGVFPKSIPECNGTFAGDVSTLGLNLLDPGRPSLENASESEYLAWPLRDGSGFAFRSFSPQTNNSIRYQEEDTRLHMMILSSRTTISPICARVNSTELTPSSPGTAEPDPSQGAANTLSGPLRWNWVISFASTALLPFLT